MFASYSNKGHMKQHEQDEQQNAHLRASLAQKRYHNYNGSLNLQPTFFQTQLEPRVLVIEKRNPGIIDSDSLAILILLLGEPRALLWFS